MRALIAKPVGNDILVIENKNKTVIKFKYVKDTERFSMFEDGADRECEMSSHDVEEVVVDRIAEAQAASWR